MVVLEVYDVCCHVKWLLVYRCPSERDLLGTWRQCCCCCRLNVSLISLDCSLTWPGVFFCFSFLPFDDCFLLNLSIKLRTNLCFGSGSLVLTSHTLLPSLLLSLSVFSPLLLGGCVDGLCSVTFAANCLL